MTGRPFRAPFPTRLRGRDLRLDPTRSLTNLRLPERKNTDLDRIPGAMQAPRVLCACLHEVGVVNGFRVVRSARATCTDVIGLDRISVRQRAYIFEMCRRTCAPHKRSPSGSMADGYFYVSQRPYISKTRVDAPDKRSDRRSRQGFHPPPSLGNWCRRNFRGLGVRRRVRRNISKAHRSGVTLVSSSRKAGLCHIVSGLMAGGRSEPIKRNIGTGTSLLTTFRTRVQTKDQLCSEPCRRDCHKAETTPSGMSS